MAALAHQFAGLISPLHGSFSADNLPVRLTICLINEVCPPMLTGPKRAIFSPKRADRLWPDHRAQLPRLIREGPVFVNVERRSNCGSLKRRIWRE
jgi:hypothetical protein